LFLTKEFNIDLSVYNNTIKLIIETINNLNNNTITSDFCVAGGFARELFHSLTSNNLDSIEDYIYKNNGDIDLFFSKTNKNVKKITANTFSFLHKNYSIKSERDVINYNTIFSDNVEFILTKDSKHFSYMFEEIDTKTSWNKKFGPRIKFQHIYTKYNNIDDLINDFDFTNSMYSFVVNENKIKFYYNEKAFFFDSQKILDVNKAKNNLFCKRVKKYITTKNLDKLSDNSLCLIKKYIQDIAFNNIEIYAYTKEVDKNKDFSYADSFKRECLEILHSIDLLTENDLLLFIDRWSIQKHTYDSCGDYFFAVESKTVDWAIDKIRG
jgi:hypothetical protein